MGKEQPEKEVPIWNPYGKRVLMEKFYVIIYHDAQGNVRYFSIVEGLERASNEILEMLIDQLRRNDEDELRLRLKMEHELRMNKEKSEELKKKKR